MMPLRIKGHRKAVSNIIVVVFSLIIVVTIYVNLILWNYEMNQFDWERMSEKIKIITVENDSGIYNPAAYTTYGSTTLVSGNTSDLASDNAIYMVFRSYPAASTAYTKNLTAHSENTTIGGSLYYVLKDTAADGNPTTLTVSSATTGRKLWGKFIYSLQGVTEISAANWTFRYRVMRSNTAVRAHANVDIKILKSDGTVREIIATNVANSTDLSAAATTWETVSATYTWTTYNVVNQSDYLEIDFYCEVTIAVPKSKCSLRIDDNTLGIADQTKIENVIFSFSSSQHILEVEFMGCSDTFDWAQLVWIVDSAWTTGSVNVTLQLYNYTLGGYPESGNGFITYTSSNTSNTDEKRNQTITTNPNDFRNATGHWKMKITGIKATNSTFDLKVDWIELRVIRGMRLTLKNEGSITSHIISLWIIDSSSHRRYDADLFINSGETWNYSRPDINIPGNKYILKVVTERGNIATFSDG